MYLISLMHSSQRRLLRPRSRRSPNLPAMDLTSSTHWDQTSRRNQRSRLRPTATLGPGGTRDPPPPLPPAAADTS
ncbi:hypothetical protein CRUP_006564, partial [Coryphaenoides rupestris]